jgi:predicted nucleic acid-binding protein
MKVLLDTNLLLDVLLARPLHAEESARVLADISRPSCRCSTWRR